eukprot:snap_masked-scaffold_2-processed-gene-16.30-mRNA-1 protein AED:1.00 eAED:1.00 QI:0/-1/0/0/-1/1/1/0/434
MNKKVNYSLKRKRQQSYVFRCNVCFLAPIERIRWVCDICHDFSVCEKCIKDVLFNTDGHDMNHTFNSEYVQQRENISVVPGDEVLSEVLTNHSSGSSTHSKPALLGRFLSNEEEKIFQDTINFGQKKADNFLEPMERDEQEFQPVRKVLESKFGFLSHFKEKDFPVNFNIQAMDENQLEVLKDYYYFCVGKFAAFNGKFISELSVLFFIFSVVFGQVEEVKIYPEKVKNTIPFKRSNVIALTKTLFLLVSKAQNNDEKEQVENISEAVNNFLLSYDFFWKISLKQAVLELNQLQRNNSELSLSELVDNFIINRTLQVFVSLLGKQCYLVLSGFGEKGNILGKQILLCLNYLCLFFKPVRAKILNHKWNFFEVGEKLCLTELNSSFGFEKKPVISYSEKEGDLNSVKIVDEEIKKSMDKLLKLYERRSIISLKEK